MSRSSPKTASFTLIEVLVVITIISALVALLMPSLSASKQQAESIQCMSNLRQIGMAIEMYGQERGFFPWGIEGNKDWSYTIQPYLQKASGLTYGVTQHNYRSTIIQCPSRQVHSTNTISNYGVHDKLFGNPSSWWHPGPYPRQYPYTTRIGEVFMVADANQITATLGGESRATVFNGMGGSMTSDYDPATAETVIPITLNKDEWPVGLIRWRHLGMQNANFVFVDGHVESIKLAKFKQKHVRLDAE